ncbi:MAG: hypothetical protein P8N76_16305 [Pirellulaceae bacterium]|nr:hypothetical protein [Pirellulaceae bacterium]
MSHDSEQPEIPLSENSSPLNVPVFNCIVHIAITESGAVQARVANLPGIEVTAPNERAALSQIVPIFKQHVMDSLEKQEKIGWIDPPPAAGPSEQTRLIPVHL